MSLWGVFGWVILFCFLLKCLDAYFFSNQHDYPREDPWDVVCVENVSEFEERLTFRNGQQVQGKGTVWHYYPGGIRCETSMEVDITNSRKEYGWLYE